MNRPLRLLALAGLAAAVVVAACTAGSPPAPQATAVRPVAAINVPAVAGLRPAAAFAGTPDARLRAMELFQEAGKVIQSPRCLNCHPNGDRPHQGDAMRLHEPLVVRGPDNHGATGMTCGTCHGRQNFEAGNGMSVPGSKDWHVAPLEMAWVGRSLGQICEQIKDPRRNGGKTLAQIVDHMAHDELVGWGWHPGSGRTPAPGTQEVFGGLIRGWAEAGAHCPV
jgi:hypothetical protein